MQASTSTPATRTVVTAPTPTVAVAATPVTATPAAPASIPAAMFVAATGATPLVVQTSTRPAITATVAPAGGGAGAILLEKAVAELHAVLRRESGAGGGLTTSFGFLDSGGVWMRADVADVVTLVIVPDATIGGLPPTDVEDGSVLVAVKFEEQEPYSWQLLLHANGASAVQPLLGGAAPGVELKVRCVVFRLGLPALAGDCFIEVCVVDVRGSASAAVVTNIVAQGALAKRPQRSHFASFQSRVFRLY